MPSLVFEVDHIDNPWKANINYVGVYSQIRHLLDSGFRYWFDSEEIAKLNTRNRAYETLNLARELIATRYRKPSENEKASISPPPTSSPASAVRYACRQCRSVKRCRTWVL